MAANPLEQLRRWYAEAEAAGEPRPDGMVLATVSAEGRPSARVVLYKGIARGGLTFFTNYESLKGADLAARPVAAAVFHWPSLHRQVRVEGSVDRLTAAESDAYFESRPRGSRLAAAASPQSRVIGSREQLMRAVEQIAAEHPDAVPRPDHWGGYRLLPESVEFWQGREHRLHDRLRYRREEERWRVERLAP